MIVGLKGLGLLGFRGGFKAMVAGRLRVEGLGFKVPLSLGFWGF